VCAHALSMAASGGAAKEGEAVANVSAGSCSNRSASRESEAGGWTGGDVRAGGCCGGGERGWGCGDGSTNREGGRGG
jgi:hypothetical protein